MPAPPPSPGSPDPIFPDYRGACLSTLVPALLSGSAGGNGDAARSPDWLPTPAREARQIVLLIVDGLGWQQLISRRELAPTLNGAAGIERSITSVTPTTTACALTSIATGRPPSDHGLLGYRLATADAEIMNALRWTVGTNRPRDARQELPASAYQPYPPFPGASRPVPVVSRGEFGGTGFTAAHLGASPLAGYKVTSSLIVEVRRLLADGEPFIYAYYDGIDKVAHEHGIGPYYDAELRAVDRLVGDIAASLEPGAVLVVSADHGQINIGTNVELLGQEVMGATRFLSGEGRFRWLHACAGAADDLYAIVSERYRDTTWVMRREQLIDEGWFGGPLRDGVIDRLGDVALIPHAPVAFLDPADAGESTLAARHGSLTADEMLVPLVAVGGGSI